MQSAVASSCTGKIIKSHIQKEQSESQHVFFCVYLYGKMASNLIQNDIESNLLKTAFWAR